MEKVLVIGASGLLGNRMMELYASNYQVYGTYNEHASSSANAYKLDVLVKDDVSKLVKSLKPAVIIDTHGLTSVALCEDHQKEAYAINVEGTRNVAESAKESGCKYVFISTDGVFKGDKTQPYTEMDKPEPVNYYGMTKMLAEQIIASLDMDYIIGRTSILFGKGGARQSRSFTNWVISELSSKHKIDVVTDQFHNPTYTDNLSDFIIKLYEKDRKGLFHTAGKDTINRFDFANKIADVFGLDKSLISPTTTAQLGQVKKPLMTGLNISNTERAASMQGLHIDEALNLYKKSL